MTKKTTNIHLTTYTGGSLVVLILAKKKSQITYQNFLNKSLVRPNSKSSICQRFQSISYKTNPPCFITMINIVKNIFEGKFMS